jgi:hypothetical protein
MSKLCSGMDFITISIFVALLVIILFLCFLLMYINISHILRIGVIFRRSLPRPGTISSNCSAAGANNGGAHSSAAIVANGNDNNGGMHSGSLQCSDDGGMNLSAPNDDNGGMHSGSLQSSDDSGMHSGSLYSGSLQSSDDSRMHSSAANDDTGQTQLGSLQSSDATPQVNSLRNCDMGDPEVTATGTTASSPGESLLNLKVFTHITGVHGTSNQWFQPLAFAECGAKAGCPCCMDLFQKGSSRNEHILFCPTITGADNTQLLMLFQRTALDSLCSFSDDASCDSSAQLPPLPLPLAVSTHRDQVVNSQDQVSLTVPPP